MDHTVPYAAAHMINVTNSGGKSDRSPREWFGHAVKARMDYELAYRYIEHHLLPQWQGSHQEMYEFELECLNTKRFDTSVPFHLINILVTIDEQLGSKGDIWREDGVYDNVNIVLGNLEKELPKTKEFSSKKITAEWILTLHGMVAAKADRYDDARKALDKAGANWNQSALQYAKCRALDGARVYALTGGGSEDVKKFEDLIAEGGSSELENGKPARELLEKAASAAKEPQAKLYFDHWKKHLLWREQFEKGDWVKLTFDEDLSMWQAVRGTWIFENPHSIVCAPFLLRPMYSSINLRCEVPFPGPLELEYDVAQLDRSDSMSGVMLGDTWDETSHKTGCLFYIDPRGNAHGIHVPRLNIDHHRGDTQTADHVRIQAWDGACLYYLNDLEFPIRSMTGMTLGDHIELSVIKKKGPTGRTRFSNLRVRKLALPPPPMEEGADRLGYFDGLIAAHPNDGLLYYQRGVCRATKKQWAEAEADLKKAASLANDVPQSHLDFNNVERSLGKFAEAVEEVERYLKIDPENAKAHNYLAWTLATCRDEKVRNGKLAVENARKACELTNYEDWTILDTQAAACAESGDFDEASKWQMKAVELAREPRKPQLRSTLELYKSKKPYHEQ
jgi:tetratricopeptide (TPR) repeat protein